MCTVHNNLCLDGGGDHAPLILGVGGGAAVGAGGGVGATARLRCPRPRENQLKFPLFLYRLLRFFINKSAYNCNYRTMSLKSLQKCCFSFAYRFTDFFSYTLF